MPGKALSELSLLELLEGTGVEAPGWYGKMAVLGDFASRRLPQHFIDACDAWLARGVDASRARLGARWLDVYLTGPIWRFAWAPGIIDAQWWYGVMMPSVDKVGRYFPLVVARVADSLPGSADGLQAYAAWYAHLSAAALGTLRPGASLDDFESSLARAPALLAAAPSASIDASALPGRIRHTLQGTPSLPSWVQALLLNEAQQRFAGHSLWWPDHADSPDNSLSVGLGLPQPEQFHELLEGRW